MSRIHRPGSVREGIWLVLSVIAVGAWILSIGGCTALVLTGH